MTGTPSVQKLSLFALTAMVVGSMVGSGIFSLPRTFGIATGPFGAIFAWCIAGGGMYMMARVFQLLAERKPALDAGVYAYAKEGFGDYPGFLSVLGYWTGSCIGNVSYWVLIKSTLGAFFPVFGDGNTVIAIVVASAGIWLFHFMILRGVQQAAAINTIVTIAKIVPILIFIVILIFTFKDGHVPLQFLGRRGHAGQESVRADPRDNVGHRVRVSRHRGCERVFTLRQGAIRCWRCDDHGLCGRHQSHGARHDAALCGAAPCRNRRYAATIHGHGARSGGRPLGRGLRQHRASGFRARALILPGR